VEEVLDPTLVADEPEPLVNQESRDCAGWHVVSSRPPCRGARACRKSLTETRLFELDGQKRGHYREFAREKSSERSGCAHLPRALFRLLFLVFLLLIVFVGILIVIETVVVVFGFQP
jgi:hypothetical protein